MNRRLLVARISVDGVPLTIATVHLESMSDTAMLRKKQLGVCHLSYSFC
jgi:endonuclease/exonuclease/phosphatase family metal-dependent hydrolase